MAISQSESDTVLPGDEGDLEILEMRACLDLLGIRSESQQDRYQTLLDPDGIVHKPRSAAGIRGAEVLYDALLERLRLCERGDFSTTDLLSGVRYIFALLRRSGLLSTDPARAEILLQNIQSFAASGGPDGHARQKHAAVAFSAAVLLFNAMSGAETGARWNLLRMETLEEILRCANAADQTDRVVSFMVKQGCDMIERYYASRYHDDREIGTVPGTSSNESEKGNDFAKARCGFYRALFHALISAEARIRFHADILDGSDFDSVLIRTGCKALHVVEATDLKEDSDHALAEELVCRALSAPNFTKFDMLLRLDIVRNDAHMKLVCEALANIDDSLYRSLLNKKSEESRVIACLHRQKEIIETKLRVLWISQTCARNGMAPGSAERMSADPISESADCGRLVPYDVLAKGVCLHANQSNIDLEVEKWVILSVQFGLLRARIDQAHRVVRVLYAYEPETAASRSSWLKIANSLESLRQRTARITDTTEVALLAP